MTDGTILCSRCGFANVRGDQFCGSCGAFLEWEGAPVEPVAAPVPAAQAGSPVAPPAQTAPPAPGATTPAVAAAGLVRCPACGIANEAARTFCQTCGAKLVASAVVAGRTRAEVAAAVAAVPGSGPSASGTVAPAGGRAPAPTPRQAGRSLPGWLLAVVVLGVLVGVAAVVVPQLLRGGSPTPDVSTAPSAAGSAPASAGAASAAPSVAAPSAPAGASPTPSASPVAATALRLTGASASSIVGGNTARYGPQLAIDGSLKTSWQEGSATEKGQWIEVSFAPSAVSAVVIRNGYQASTALFRGNLRLRDVQISVDGGAPQAVTLRDVTAGQRIELPPVAGATSLRITIVSTYPSVKTSVAGTPFKDAP